MNNLLILIPGAPIIGSLLIVLFGHYFSAKYSAFLATAMVFLSAICTIFLWMNFYGDVVYSQNLYQWMSVGKWVVSISLTVDKITLLMLTVACCVGFLIHLFSISFMKGEKGERRYFFYLNLFIAGMVLFVMADNMIVLYLGWELMGLCSYALISFYYDKKHNAYCGRKAFVVTRIGDTALAIAIIYIFAQLGTLNFSDIFSSIQSNPQNIYFLGVICLLFLVAAISKSAQFPMHIWLPDAMTGPSTVSALIHAATMVTAGVYLLIRFHVFLDAIPSVKTLIVCIGSITAFIAATAALSQNKIKKILAYSTISQIGYMFIGVGTGAYIFALFHLMVHACFKALLFMGSGIIVNAFGGVDDVRKMGGLRKHSAFLNVTYLTGCLSLAGLPLFSASFYSKDAIITSTLTVPFGNFFAFISIFSAFLTAFYSLRMYSMVFLEKARSKINSFHLSVTMKIPLFILSFFSITLGWIQFPKEWNFGLKLLVPWLSSIFKEPALFANHHLLTIIEITVASLSLFGIAISILLSKKEWLKGKGVGDWVFFNNGWYIDALLKYIIVLPFTAISKATHKFIEVGFFNKTIINSTIGIFNFVNNGLKAMQAGALEHYLYLMIFGVISLLAYLLLFFQGWQIY